ncbi:MAG: hypothetical protein V3S81_06960 [Anaerolineales bacterium]|nr:hypothetical protein [Anaerolineales bacterium]
MATEERMKILKMIEEGKITAEEGTRLLAALGKQKRKRPVSPEGEPSWLRVRVTDINSGKEAVRVNLPFSLVNVGLKMGARFVPDIEQELAMEELAEALKEGLTGKIVDIVDEEDGKRVEIFIE